MYHLAVRKTREFAKKAALLLAALSLAHPAVAQVQAPQSAAEPEKAVIERRVEWTSHDYPILLRQTRLRKKPLRAEIYQIDRQAIGDRKPLLLIHGLRGEYWRHFRWKKVITRLSTYPDFCRKYKIYLIRYDSTDLVKNILPQFKAALLDLHRQSGGKPLTILALSLGGNLVQEAITEPAIDSAVRLVFTLGTPFHGSPLFCRDWFMYSLYKNLSYPWTRIDHSIAYRLYFQRNPNLLQDLKWDNCDRYIPEAGAFRSRLPFGPKGVLTLAGNANTRLLELNRSGKIDKTKFITYAGYLINPYLKPGLRRHIESTILAPYSLITVIVPAHLAREHPVLKMLNREITRIIPDEQSAPSRNVYALNDGITPVNSAVFVVPDACQPCSMARESDLSRLKPHLDVRLARVFRNADHLTFIDGYRAGRASPMIRDELNPQDGPRTMFDWILSDLMQADTVPGQLATDCHKEPALEVK